MQNIYRPGKDNFLLLIGVQSYTINVYVKMYQCMIKE